MDRERFSAIAHGEMAFWNPVAESVVDDLVARLPLPPWTRVLDAGCGRGEMLIRLASRRGAMGIGVDRSRLAVAAARAAAARAGCRDRIEFRLEPFDPDRFAGWTFDLALCVGSTHALGGAAPALGALGPLLLPGGLLLLGEGYWKREPDPGYLAAIGGTRESLRDRAGNEALGPEAGLVPLETLDTSTAEWDRYEDLYAGNVERYAAAHPRDPDVPAMLARIRPWREAYLRWGRETLGFALYLFRRPATPAEAALRM